MAEERRQVDSKDFSFLFFFDEGKTVELEKKTSWLSRVDLTNGAVHVDSEIRKKRVLS